jgi:hypothetical protein
MADTDTTTPTDRDLTMLNLTRFSSVHTLANARVAAKIADRIAAYPDIVNPPRLSKRTISSAKSSSPSRRERPLRRQAHTHQAMCSHASPNIFIWRDDQ